MRPPGDGYAAGMTTDPGYPGAESRLDKLIVADVQGALDVTFNDEEGATLEVVEARLREELEDAGVLEDLSPAWIEWAAARIADGAPVIAQPEE